MLLMGARLVEVVVNWEAITLKVEFHLQPPHVLTENVLSQRLGYIDPGSDIYLVFHVWLIKD